MKAWAWQKLTPLVILAVALAIGVLQVLIFPVVATRLSFQVATESLLLLIIVSALFQVGSVKEVRTLDNSNFEDIYPLIVLGLGLFTVSALTDVLDEFLAHSVVFLSFAEDATMIAGFVSLLVGLNRWSTVRNRQERQLEAQRNRLARQNDRLEQFASLVSHDLRNPLNVAIGRLDVVRKRGDSEHLAVIAESLDRMETIIGDMLELARLDDDVDEPTPVSLRKIAEDSYETVAEDGIRLDASDVDDVTVTASGTYLRHLFENLFRNSVEHALEPSGETNDIEAGEGNGSQATTVVADGSERLTVRVGVLPDDTAAGSTDIPSVTDGATGFYVEDTGPGIPADERDTVFEMGYTTNSNGTGFGLSIVEEVADIHDWSISVGESDEGGARFEIRDVEIDESLHAHQRQNR